MKIEKIAFIYLIVLGVGVLLDRTFPAEVSTFIDLLLPSTVDLRAQPFIRYRIGLFILASGLFLTLLPAIYFFGLKGMTSDQIKRVRWRHIVVLGIAMPVMWVGYPFISFCPDCWTANDALYFFLTVCVFGGLHISLQAVFLKIFC